MLKTLSEQKVHTFLEHNLVPQFPRGENKCYTVECVNVVLDLRSLRCPKLFLQICASAAVCVCVMHLPLCALNNASKLCLSQDIVLFIAPPKQQPTKEGVITLGLSGVSNLDLFYIYLLLDMNVYMSNSLFSFITA